MSVNEILKTPYWLIQLGAVGGRARLVPSTKWEVAISLTHRRPPYRRRNTTPDRLVRTFTVSCGLWSSGGPDRPGYILVLQGARDMLRAPSVVLGPDGLSESRLRSAGSGMSSPGSATPSRHDVCRGRALVAAVSACVELCTKPSRW